MGQLHYRRYFSPEEIRAIALKIDRLAGTGRTVHLLPATGLMAADAMRMWGARPSRPVIIDLFCSNPLNCVLHPCMRCIGKANQIIQVIEGQEPFFPPRKRSS